MPLTETQKRILSGLTFGHAYVSASECVELAALKQAGFVETWSTMGGFLAWHITEAGRSALQQEERSS